MVKIGIKRGYMAILIAQAVIIGICAFVLVRIYYNNNTSLLYQQASTVLDLYMLNCENKLGIVEKWSFNILSDQSMQKELVAMEKGSTQLYDSYLVQQQINSRLTGYLFSIEHCETVSFITNSGVQLASTYTSHYEPFTQDEIANIIAVSNSYNGGTVWVRDANGRTLHMLRTLKETGSANFYNLGVLVLTCPVNDIFAYDFSESYAYNPIIEVMDGQDTVYSSLPQSDESLAETSLDSDQFYTVGRTSGDTGWQYNCHVYNAEMLQGVNTLNTQLVVVLTLVLVGSLLVSLKFSFSITSRIEKLSRNIDAVRTGDYNIPPESGKNRLQVNEVAALSSNFQYMTTEIDHLINDVYRKQIMIKDMQYKILRGQINPHFLNNTLDTVNSLAKQDGQNDISRVVQSLSRMLRTSLTDRELHTLREEQAFLTSYISIQKIRFEERLDFAMDDMSQFHHVMIPKLTLQPLVENSIKYGLERYSKTCTIHISSAVEGETLCIRIEDNGPGMSAEYIEQIMLGKAESENSGIGIKNIHERIRLAFGDAYGISFESTLGEGTIALIRIPVEEEEEQDGLQSADQR
ncbi:MAG: sensor histidine kinase [Oscillospiraceae bacterium]